MSICDFGTSSTVSSREVMSRERTESFTCLYGLGNGPATLRSMLSAFPWEQKRMKAKIQWDIFETNESIDDSRWTSRQLLSFGNWFQLTWIYFNKLWRRFKGAPHLVIIVHSENRARSVRRRKMAKANGWVQIVVHMIAKWTKKIQQ